MPVIHIQMTKEDGGLNTQQKEKLIEKMTQAFVDVVGRGEKTAVVLIDEFHPDNYGIGKKTISAIRNKN